MYLQTLTSYRTIDYEKSNFPLLLLLSLLFFLIPSDSDQFNFNVSVVPEKSAPLILKISTYSGQNAAVLMVSFYEQSLLAMTVAFAVLSLVFIYFFLQKKQKANQLAARNKELEDLFTQNKNTLQLNSKYLERTVNQLAKTNLELDTFLYKTSHDLRGPLSTLEGLCNIALMEEIESVSVMNYIQMKKDIITRMKLLLFRIIEIGDIRNHKINKITIPLRLFIKKIIKSMHRVEGFKDISFQIDIPDELTLESDAEMLEIILDNIIKNSIQHNRTHFAEHYVKIFVNQFNNFLELHISENGYSIPEVVFDKVFNLFFKNTEKSEGFGLGLYKVKIAVEKLQGDIKLIKTGEDETVFIITLPKDTKTQG